MQSTRRLRTAALVALSVVPFLSFAASGPVFMNGQSIYGQPATQGAPVRVVDLAATDRLNVGYGETVVFRSGAQQFSWTFNGLDRRSVDVGQIAPAGFASRPFAVHVGRSPSNRH
ncbi:CzcE family metal-binding protein [Aquincola sp. J276]|uniref:CzcE family metal-binding protein n=1 Tax=Aquincola sp. J276 TaxID=2898432 RepID=UPI002150C999|nr:CzcE family metal-binding protein [Aquincola sp. J276]MCR5864587.1 CzcE family metal-binding protein [Aquincola sp. J276]